MSEVVKKTKSKALVDPQQEPMEPQQAAARSPWQEMKSISLPRGKVDDARSEYVSVNGKSYQIPCGKTVEVPLPIYEVLMRKDEALDELEDYRDSISKESFPKNNHT